MSGCQLINDSNYATYDAKYNTYTADGKPIGRCINPTTLRYTGNSNECNDDEFACYSNYRLTMKRNKLDSNLEEIYNPQNGRFATFDSNYQTTMLTGVIWAMLGTTVLYYAFTKI